MTVGGGRWPEPPDKKQPAPNVPWHEMSATQLASSGREPAQAPQAVPAMAAMPAMGMMGVPAMGMMAMPTMMGMGMGGMAMGMGMPMGMAMPMMGMPVMSMHGAMMSGAMMMPGAAMMPAMHPMMAMANPMMAGAAMMPAQPVVAAPVVVEQQAAPAAPPAAVVQPPAAATPEPAAHASSVVEDANAASTEPSATAAGEGYAAAAAASPVAVGSSKEGGSSEAEVAKKEEKILTCHLHIKYAPKCKFCLRAKQALEAKEKSSAGAEKQAGVDGDKADKVDKGENDSAEVDYSRRTFNCSPMLKDQILSSTYFKSLLSINSIDDLIVEIQKYADTLDVYNGGTTTSPSCFACHVYRLFTLPQAEDLNEISQLIDSLYEPLVRCVGFVYMRFVLKPEHLWEMLEDYLYDEVELKYMQNGKVVYTTVGEFVEQLLISDRYFNTPLPRVPAKARGLLEERVAPLPQYRKRLQANRKVFIPEKVHDLPVEVVVAGRWVRAVAKKLIGRTESKVRVKLEETGEVRNVHLGKVVLADDDRLRDAGDSDGPDRKRRRSRSRSRSRSRWREGSPDWSRYKGPDEETLVSELRMKKREGALMGSSGRHFSKRPVNVDSASASQREPGMDNEADLPGSSQPRRPGQKSDGSSGSLFAKREPDEELLKKQRAIFEKYGAGTGQTKAVGHGDIDLPEVLRLG
eukprot:TRINITY_DN48762_c0_g1_i1.p1 TRINITY_DN48762_c0_g1~~TRINITY_DN48762_c0_g1_i1.p1  ORF type:complete len:710 (+),score=166.00 TRINITY_DN48762_c0_g1_i1:64-2130(+)